MLLLYRIALYLAVPVILIRLLFRSSRNRQYLSGIPHRFGWCLPLRSTSKDPAKNGNSHSGIWIHAVSVGEVNAAIPLVKALLEKYEDRVITVTTMTPTGSDRVKSVFGDSIQHCYLPYDYPGSVKRFFNRVKPALGMVMETEIWPNLITECHKRNIPLIYTNVRLSTRSLKGYLKFKSLFEPVLKKVDKFAVQAEADAQRIKHLGASSDAVEVTGSIKFDMPLPASLIEAAQSVRRTLGRNRPVWVAGSTREGEESYVIESYLLAKKSIENLMLVLVPRHPERFNSVLRLCNRRGCKTVLRSESVGEVSEDTDIYLVDSMGELALFISASDVVYIGGSLVPTGGHNLLEACAAGVAVIFGPHMFNFKDISELVLAKGAGIQIANSEELGEVVIKLINDPILRDQYGTYGKELIEENKGALDKICAMVDNYLETGH